MEAESKPAIAHAHPGGIAGSLTAVRFLTCAASVAAFLYQFENCMTTTALPELNQDIPGLGAVLSLVAATYLVAATIAIVPAGRLAGRAGHQRVLSMALAAMAAGSLICALAPGVLVLLAGRFIQGLGGGAMASAAYGMVTAHVPGDARRAAMGKISLGAALGMMAGTPLGGIIARDISWRAMFAIQVPLLLVASLLVLKMRMSATDPKGTPLGVGRSLTLGAGAGLACLAGSFGREWGPFPWGIIALLVPALLIIFVFVHTERSVKAPLFPADVWRAEAFWRYWGILFACAATLGSTLFLMPFYLHEADRTPIPTASELMVIIVALYSLAAFNAGRLQCFGSAERVALIGAGLALAGVFSFIINIESFMGGTGTALGCGLIGFGLGMIFPAVNSGCVSRLPESVRTLGASLLPFGINLGSMAGVVIAAEIREAGLHAEAVTTDYAHAFLVPVICLAIAGAGLWPVHAAPSQKPALA